MSSGLSSGRQRLDHHSTSGVAPAAAAFRMPFEPGDVIAGKYRVQQLIGTGGVGFVVAATHVGLDDSVALKFLKPEFATNQEAVSRFTIEARASFKIKNEHVARVLDVDTLADGTPFMVMELLEGSDLRSILETHRYLPVSLAVDFVLQSCEALAAAHALHIVHRDIKPENLFVTQYAEGDQIKVLDFGISKVALTQQPLPGRKTRATALTMMAVGTPPYMSPEQVRASTDLDARADIWSLGCVLYELLTGNAPFERMSLMQACAAVLEEEPLPLREGCPEASAELEAAVMRCLRKEPAERYGDVAELARALAPFAARSAGCANRCSELLAEGMRRSDPELLRHSEPPPRRPEPLAVRIPTHTKIPVPPVQPVKRPPQRVAPPVSPMPPVDAEIILDPLPRKNHWILVAVVLLTALSGTYLVAMRYSAQGDLDRGFQLVKRATRASGISEPAEAPAAVAPAAVVHAAAQAPVPAEPVAATPVATPVPVTPAVVATPTPAPAPAAQAMNQSRPRPARRAVSRPAPKNEDPDVGF
ncbi:MAG TPA: serine/threonine-protein kinase [Polyangiales bacterium]|nr:serine/threonine-protein kinase [Polyangiales bacterium]